MKTEYLILPAIALILGLLVLAIPSTVPINEGGEINYEGFVCVWKNNQLVECKHNLITNVGKNNIKTALGQGTNALSNKIAIGNCTGACSQTSADTTLSGEYTTQCSSSLAATTGTYNSAGTRAWNITYQWTVDSACANVNVNATGLYNATGSSQLFAEANFTNVLLQGNDKLNVTWGIEVS